MGKKPIAAAVTLALLGMTALAAAAQAQEADAVQTVQVTGIRASLAKSLSVKKNATANIEVITAEDVGKPCAAPTPTWRPLIRFCYKWSDPGVRAMFSF